MPDDPLGAALRIDAKLVDQMKRVDAWAFADGALPRKTKLLIAMAYDAAHGAADGVRSLARQALAAGAGKEEIGEALRVAFALSGVGSVYVASRALAELFP